MESTMNQTESKLKEKMEEIQRLDLKLRSLLGETDQEKEAFNTELSKIQDHQRHVTGSFDALSRRLDKYKEMKRDVASRLFIFLYLYIQRKLFETKMDGVDYHENLLF